MKNIQSHARKLGLTAGALLLAMAGAVVGGGIYLSNVIQASAFTPNHAEDARDLIAQDIGADRITLRVTEQTAATGDWWRAGVFGLAGEDGYAQVDAILERTADAVVREFMPLSGRIEVGERVRLESYAFAGDPLSARGIPFTDVTYASDAGEFPAWFVDGASSRWVLFVHGQNSTRAEALRSLPVWFELGHPALVITYRNDAGVPPSADGSIAFGLTEWQDLEGAARYALERGAADLVLVGYSMGGAIVTNFLYESALADRVRGVILDSPVLDFEAVIDFGGQQQGYPGLLVNLGKAFARLRFGTDWQGMNYLRRTQELDAPILLIHGAADPTVPVATSDALAQARPDIVQYVRSEQAAHVRTWNLDAQAYENRLRAFLQALDA